MIPTIRAVEETARLETHLFSAILLRYHQDNANIIFKKSFIFFHFSINYVR